MPYYKDLDGKLHYLETVEYENMLPIGSVEITDAEALAISSAPGPVTVDMVRGEATKRIHALIPDIYGVTDKTIAELNMLMAVVDLVNKKVDGAATVEELAQIDAAALLKQNIEAVRAASASIIAELETLQDSTGFDYINHILWP